jgi:hypothetical protein
MTVAALITWIITAFGGLFLLTIWLIEYDREFQSVAATRLPIPVLSAHALLAIGGLVLWAIYLITDQDRLADFSVLILALAAVLGVTMAVRWIGVYRRYRSPGGAGRRGAAMVPTWAAVPPERHFPVPVVVGHGVFALTTIALVALTVLRSGS